LWGGKREEIRMLTKSAVVLASALIIGLSATYAQDQKPPPEQDKPSERGMMGGMMGGGGMMAQMSRMMENCNKMMEGHIQRRQNRR
jgi:hypothetical protein